MNTTTKRLFGCIVLLLTACSTNPITSSPPQKHPIADVTPAKPLPERDQQKQPVSVADLKLQLSLAKEAIKLNFLQLELAQLKLKLLSQGNSIPSELGEKINALDIRQRAIANQQFSLSGHLFLNTSEPGDFAAYLAECLSKINNALDEESPEVRQRFYGKTAFVQLDLKAGGRIESVIPSATKQDKEFGDYLHDLIWKVPNFPEVPQLMARQIERVSISISLTLYSAEHGTPAVDAQTISPTDAGR